MKHERARQWSRTAFALAALFGSFPVAGRLILGEWAFEGATGIACLWLALGVYLHIRSRRMKPVPDSAAMLDEALRLFSIGDAGRANSLLGRAIRQNPRFWQAFQCRGEGRLQSGDIRGALNDFDQAIRLAPQEPHLHELRAQAEKLSGEI